MTTGTAAQAACSGAQRTRREVADNPTSRHGSRLRFAPDRGLDGVEADPERAPEAALSQRCRRRSYCAIAERVLQRVGRRRTARAAPCRSSPAFSPSSFLPDSNSRSSCRPAIWSTCSSRRRSLSCSALAELGALLLCEIDLSVGFVGRGLWSIHHRRAEPAAGEPALVGGRDRRCWLTRAFGGIQGTLITRLGCHRSWSPSAASSRRKASCSLELASVDKTALGGVISVNGASPVYKLAGGRDEPDPVVDRARG